jgi:hypothetical protein
MSPLFCSGKRFLHDRWGGLIGLEQSIVRRFSLVQAGFARPKQLR